SSTLHLVALAQTAPFRHPGSEALPQLVAAIEDHHLHRGYASYWWANSASWASRDNVEMLPVEEPCGPAADTLCPYLLNVTDAEFRPVSGPSFVVVQTSRGRTWRPSTAIYGKPTSSFGVDQLVVYVYPYDVAGRFVR